MVPIMVPLGHLGTIFHDCQTPCLFYFTQILESSAYLDPLLFIRNLIVLV